MHEFVDWLLSEKSSGILTLLTGAFGFLVFRFQQIARKREVAQITLLEIENAERSIDEIGRTGSIESASILPVNSWNQHAHYLVRDLDSDELSAIKSFYDNCSRAEAQLKKIDESLSVASDQKTRTLQDKLLELADEFRDDKEALSNPVSEYNLRKIRITQIAHGEQYYFLPSTPRDRLLRSISLVRPITTSTAGTKLKKLARRKF